MSLFYGSPDGLPAEASRVVQGAGSGAQIGFTAAPAGDVDADGYNNNMVSGSGEESSGALYLIQGHP